ncbi:MAG: hypothetical protein A2878_00370 [Candidatus Moranbacteria bacterium RIFCSPHIGHO2_01_FULL_54_31]|nr:MAG: hypothetical protein A2878_00370 [Candidatus Moranbacteria bacterium RIFCSPHIGHO2_01_FULL_54_31]
MNIEHNVYEQLCECAGCHKLGNMDQMIEVNGKWYHGGHVPQVAPMAHGNFFHHSYAMAE